MTMNTRNMLNRFVTGMIVVVAALVWCGTAQAQTNFYWTNSASSLSTWSTTANWTNGYPSQNGGTNVILNFNVAGNYTSSNDWTTGVFTNNRLVFGAGTVTNAGGTLAFINNGAVMPVVTNYSGNTATINNPLILATNTTFVGANDITVNGDMSGSGALTKTGSGTLTLTGSNSYSGTNTVNGGTLKAGSATGISSASVLTVASGTFDLNGNNVTVANLVGGSGNTGTITDTSSATDTGTVTISSINWQGGNRLYNLITNGPTRKLALVIKGNSSMSNGAFNNVSNTFSGLTLTSSGGNGLRFYTDSAIYTGTPGSITRGQWGCGPITIGTNALDKAQLMLGDNANVTLPNDIIVNTALGTDNRGSFRLNATNITLAGTITANLAPVHILYYATTAAGSAALSGRVTGSKGMTLDYISGLSFMVTLSNAAGDNDYQGDTTNGASCTLQLGANNQIPNGPGKGNVVLSGILDLNGHSDTINGLSGGGVISNGVAGAAALTVGDNDQPSTFSGTIKSTGGTLTLAKIGAGTLTLSGSNTGNGAVTVNGGILISSGVNTYNGATWVNAGRFVEVTGSSCSNSALYLADGATNSVSAVAGGTWSCASLTCTGGTTTLDFDFGSLQDTLAPLNIIGGFSVTGTINVVVRNIDLPATGTYPLVAYGVNGVGPGSFVLTSPPGVTASLNNNTVSKQLELVVTAVPQYTSQPTSVWTNQGNGAWSTAANWTNSIPDGTNVVADFSKVNINAGLFVNVDSTRTIGTLVYNNSNAQNLTVSNSPVTLATTSGVPAIIVSNRTVTISSALQGTQGFIKNGAGSLTLSGANTYSGPTIIKASTLTMGGSYPNNSYYLGDTSGGLAATLNLSATLTASKIVVQSGGSGVSTITANGACTLTAPITLGSSGIAHDLTFTPPGSATLLFNGSIGDPIGLSGSGGTVTLNMGTGTVRFDTANTYSGDTRQMSGANTFLVNHLLALQNSTLYMKAGDTGTPKWYFNSILGGLKGERNLDNQGYTLAIGNNNQTTTYSGVLTGAGGLTKIGTGTLTLVGANTYAGATTISNSFIGVSNNLAMSTGLVTLSGGGIAAAAGTWAITNVVNLSQNAKFDIAGSLALMGPVTNSGALTKIGAGTLTLSATNTYTGGTTVSNGALIVNGSVTGAVTVVAGSTLGGTGVVAGVVTNNGTITAGDITTNGTLTVTNLVMGEYSTCVWNADANATTNDVIQVNGTLTLPQYATVTVSRAGARIPSPGVLFAGFTNNLSSADLSKWVINGAPASTRVKVSGSQVVLVVPNGWVISLQ